MIKIFTVIVCLLMIGCQGKEIKRLNRLVELQKRCINELEYAYNETWTKMPARDFNVCDIDPLREVCACGILKEELEKSKNKCKNE